MERNGNLCVSRRIGEAVVIDSVTTVTVVKIERGKVFLNISAPLDIPVDRIEVHQRKEQAK